MTKLSSYSRMTACTDDKAFIFSKVWFNKLTESLLKTGSNYFQQNTCLNLYSSRKYISNSYSQINGQKIWVSLSAAVNQSINQSINQIKFI